MIMMVAVVIGVAVVAPIGWFAWDMARINRRRRKLETQYQTAWSQLDIRDINALFESMVADGNATPSAPETPVP